ncbi:MAG: L-rhamnose mutarotase [Candidatus Latescibacterota bacterium]|nr:L-rhamnose mutarotase [Candidatus Latescibacterota bacterium]
MARVGFKMKLKPGNEVEYKERHDEVWPEMLALMRKSGIRNYSIYRDALTLFAYLEIDDPSVLDSLPQEEVVQKWWRYMEPLMECNPDSSPVMTTLQEAFHMD